MTPALGFFTEIDAPELTALLEPSHLAALRRLGASVTVGVRDVSDERARALARLRSEGVKVHLWLLLDRERGYFATYDNAADVEGRWREVLGWVRRHSLDVTRVGLDFERDLRQLEPVFQAPLRGVAGWLWHRHSEEKRAAARAAYARLVTLIHDEGFSVEAYQLPVLLDDRAAGGSLCQRVSGALDVGVDVEVVMLYTSMMGPLAPGLLQAYAPSCRCIGVGSTGGGIDPLPKLSWSELERDLRAARPHCDELRIFSLEGCVHAGFLERLEALDWTLPPPAAGLKTVAARSVRWLLQGVSRVAR